MSNCSVINPADPSGFGQWDTDCGGIAVVVNQKDWDSGLFMNHETNQRYDLHLCDTSGNIIRTIFSGRTIDGSEASADSIEYNINKGYIVVFSTIYGTGNVKMERIDLSTLAVIESVTIDNNGLYHGHNDMDCNGKTISWDYTAKWIIFTQ